MPRGVQLITMSYRSEIVSRSMAWQLRNERHSSSALARVRL